MRKSGKFSASEALHSIYEFYPRSGSGYGGQLCGPIDDVEKTIIAREMAKLPSTHELRTLWEQIKTQSRLCGWDDDGDVLTWNDGGEGYLLISLCERLRKKLRALL